MKVTRIAILLVAAIAAGGAALLVRSMLGGGTPSLAAAPPSVQATHVLVAARDIEPGQALDPSLVRWQEWPKNAVSSTFVTEDTQPDMKTFVKGAFARAPLVTGEPVTAEKIVHAGNASFMAAMLKPGMRAVAIPISEKTGAGGFVLPNDRVDVVLTRQVDNSGHERKYQSMTILQDVRVLAIDQTYREDKDQKVAVGKTATLELAPRQTELISLAQASGTLSLALRGLGDSTKIALGSESGLGGRAGNNISVIRYGVKRDAEIGGRAE